MLAHYVDQHEHAVHVVLVVFEGLGNRLAHSLQAGKVDDGINLVLCEELLHCCAVANVGLNHRYLVTDNLFNATNRFGLRVVEVVHYDHAVACFV